MFLAPLFFFSSSPSPLTFFFFFLTLRLPPISTLFPYTTLFRSLVAVALKQSIYSRGRPADGTLAQQRLQIGKHTSELQSPDHLVCRLLLEKKKKKIKK